MGHLETPLVCDTVTRRTTAPTSRQQEVWPHDTDDVPLPLSYRDADAALRFFEEAFGFTTSVRWEDPGGTVQHAEVTFGDGALMIGTAEHPTAPLEGASVDEGVHVDVLDVDAHFERAQTGGARVVYAPEDTEWGTRRYRVLDPEGYEWSFGSYRPGTTGDS
jgi:uncharacterized glyoxalase superfamily protein PhnB